MDPRGPNVLRNTLSGSTAVGRLATADAARRRSFFFLRYGRRRSEARSLHECKQVKRTT